MYIDPLDPGTAATVRESNWYAIGAKLLISEAAAAADRLTVCSGLMILDSEQNSNYLKLFICLIYLQVPNLEYLSR